MTERDLATMTGVCRICGPIDLMRSCNAWACGNRVRRTDRARLLRVYGLTIDDYDQMVHAHGSSCGICGKQPKRLHVDHDHDSGQVRGLLCGNCNRGLGIFQDDPQLLMDAAHYLKSF